ncbi:MAG: hypothetical protein Q7R66_07785 [Undibacterium sp.]|uniref:hypothetical protein n=1 Tax=Undibacterium sp. TaxID=1914977 RepID=UPI0027172AF3|nr:hypothetical protein [Undibacterium sp.]MDO8652074.1 hypothetical protein [Undibacterium sp.]
MTYDIRSLQHPKHLCAIGAFLLGAVYSFQVNAAVVAPDSAFATFYSRVTAPGKQTVGFGSNGTPVVAPGVPSVSSAGGPVQVARTGSLPLPAGARLPVTGTAKIPNSAIAAIIKKALPLVPYLGTGVALYELAKELGFIVSKSGSGVVVTKPDSSVCTVAPCYGYATRTRYDPSTVATGYKASKIAACDASASSWGVLSNGHVMKGVVEGTQCAVYESNGSGGWFGASYRADFATATVSPSAPVFLPSSDTALADAIAAQSGWPSSSAVAQALVDAQRVTGDQIPTDQPNATGPATVAGPTEKTKVGPKETTKQSNYNCTYYDGPTVMEGGSVVCTEQTTTTDAVTTTDPATGATTTTTTTASEATKPAEIPADDKPAEDPCIKNPSRNGCRSDEFDVPAGDIPKTSKTISYAAENLGFAGGSCPANRIMIAHGMAVPITVTNWADNCDKLTTYAKPMILALATFAALMIIFVGKPE